MLARTHSDFHNVVSLPPPHGSSDYAPALRPRASVPCARHTLALRIMNILIWLIVGGVIGWLASIVMKTNGQQGIVLNVVVGIIGAMIAGWLISPMLGVGTINQNNFSAPSLLVSFGGAVVLLAVVNLLRRGSTR